MSNTNNYLSQKRRKGSLSKRAELHKLSFQMTYDMIAGKHQQVINKSSSMIAFYEKHPYLIEYTPVGYVANFIYGAALSKNKMFKDVVMSKFINSKKLLIKL